MGQEYRSFQGEIKLLQTQNEFIYPVELWLLNDQVNRNGWKYTRLEEHKNRFAGTPILIAYINGGKGIGDGHNFRMTRNPKTGEEEPSFTDPNAERIVGALSENESEIRLVSRDGNTWIVGKGYLWRWYAKELVDKIERDALQGRSMSVSIETLVTDSYMDGEVEIETEYQIMGTTILGDHVMPAVADARIVALQAMEDRFKELKLRAASYQNAPDKTFIKHNKGVNTMNLFSKKQIAELHPKFAGYTVLAAGQDESGVHVCLMAEDGSTAVYTMGDLNSVVVPAQITKINAQVEFPFGESGSIQVDACSMTDGIVAELLRTKNNLEQTNESLTCANDEIQKMKDTEKVRRIKAAKEKAVQTLEQFNANREEKIDASILEKINQDIDAGVYSDRVDEDGNWVGDKDVENAVLAECATCVMEFDRKAAASRKNQYIWDQVNQGQTYDDGTVAGLLAKFDL